MFIAVQHTDVKIFRVDSALAVTREN